MVAGSALATLVVAALASLFMAWAIGAGSSGSTPFAPAVGANAISVMRAGFYVGILGLAGAIFQGASVTDAVGRQLIHGVTLSPTAAVIALTTAAVLVAVGVFAGYPIATAFTVTGAVIGAGLAMGGLPAWAKYQQIAALWIGTPIVGGGVAYLTARLLIEHRERVFVPALGALVGFILANVRFVFLAPGDQQASLSEYAVATLGGGLLVHGAVTAVAGAAVATAIALDMRPSIDRGERHFLLALGALVAFSAGGSQVGLALGPLLPLMEPFGLPVVALLLGGGIGLLLGSWTGAPRMIKAIAQDYSALGPRRSIAALIPSFAIAQTAVFFGIPVSFNEIIVSSIVGSGFAAASGGGEVSRRKMVYTVLGWIGSLIGAFLIAYGAFAAVDAILAM